MNTFYLTALAIIAAPAMLEGAQAGRQEWDPSSAVLESPENRIEGRIVEVALDARKLAVRYESRGTRTTRAFRIMKDTVLSTAERSGLRLSDFAVGDAVLVQYSIRNGQACATRIEKLESVEDAARQVAR